MIHLWHDLRFGLRLAAQRPAFTLVVVLTLALGIGANTAIFSVVNGLLLDMVPFAEPNGLVDVSERSKEVPSSSVSYLNFLDWQERNRTFDAMAAHLSGAHNLTGRDRPERVRALHTSATLFPLLRVEPILGRTFTVEEDRVGGPRVLVVSYGFWQRRLGGRSDAVGTTLTLDDQPWEVIGVMPQGFTYPIFMTLGSRVETWMPIGRFAAHWLEYRGLHPGINVTARLAAGVRLGRARADLDRIAAELAEEYPESNTDRGVNVDLLNERLAGPMRPALLVLSAAVGLVLLIACVNVANLLLARGAARSQEMAVRGALGAGRWQVMGQLLSESVLLSLAGGTAGLLVAVAGLRGLLALVDAADLPVTSHVTIDGRVLLVTLAVSVVTGLLFGLAPVFQALRSNLVEGLKEASRSSGGRQRQRLRRGLVVAEMALAVVLLVGAVLFLRTFYELVVADPGFDPHHVLSFKVALPPTAYPQGAQQKAFFDELLTRLESWPAVVSAATTSPLLCCMQDSVIAEGQEPLAPGEQQITDLFEVSPHLVATLGLRLLHGRFFDQQDRPDGRRVAVVDKLFAASFWPDEDPIGKRFKFGTDPASDGPWLEVVGVVNHVKGSGVHRGSRMQLYLPAAQRPRYSFAAVLVKTTAEPRELVPLVEREVMALDPRQPIVDLRTLEEMMAHQLMRERLSATLLAFFAALALALATIGIYGVMAYWVEQRWREIGIRMALGARPPDLRRLVMWQGLRLVVWGIGLGLGLAMLATRLIADQLYGVSPRDPATLVAVPLVLALVAAVACAVPAHRASRGEPVTALHEE